MTKVTSVVKLFGDSEAIQALRDYVEEGFEFNNVIPEPFGLEDSLEDGDLTLTDEIERLTTYGATNIMEWRRLFWGTTSPSIKTSWLSDKYIKLITEDTPPLGILKTISSLFGIVICVLHATDEKSSIVYICDGQCVELESSEDEAYFVNNIIKDPYYNYEKWETANKKVSNGKKLDMKLTFQIGSEYINAARKVIDIKNNDMAENPKKVI